MGHVDVEELIVKFEQRDGRRSRHVHYRGAVDDRGVLVDTTKFANGFEEFACDEGIIVGEDFIWNAGDDKTMLKEHFGQILRS